MTDNTSISAKKDNWIDWILAIIIGTGVVVGNFIMNHLP
jgi:hypothetical protein